MKREHLMRKTWGNASSSPRPNVQDGAGMREEWREAQMRGSLLQRNGSVGAPSQEWLWAQDSEVKHK